MEQFFDDQRTLKLLSQGIFAPYLETFAHQLSERGYARLSVRAQIRLAAYFGRWLTKHRVSLPQITSKHAALYMQYRREQPRDMKGVPATLDRFLHLLRERGAIADETITSIPTIAQKFTEEFVSYLRDERGLGKSSISNYRNHVGRCLAEYLSGSVVDLSGLAADDIVGFVQRRAAVFYPKTSKHVTAGLRAFLQFARYQGYISADLGSAVPRVANWSMVSIPRGLTKDQVALVLSSCNRRTAVGRRDYAILLLLARLGLRAGEIASLAIEDINWHEGQITVQAKNSRRLLPLPSDVGEALASYLQNGRPRTTNRALLLSGTAPVCGIRGQTVARVVRQAMLRAGIHHAASQGAHQFRHGLATQLLGQGASLVEIGELLGHRKIDTTAIYAKVDIAALRTLALLWPGGAQ